MNLHLPFNTHRSNLNKYLFNEDWQSVITEIGRHPNDAKVWSSQAGFFDGDHDSHVLPIHVACSLHAPLDVIKAIVEAYPDGLSAKETSFKRLPLHVSCQMSEKPAVIEYLAQQYVSATIEPDVLGRLPIHYCCSNGAPLDVVKTLLKANSASTLYADYNGWLPLHVAVHFGASTAVVEQLIQACPSSVDHRTKKGSNALKLAKKVSTKNKEEVIALLEGRPTQEEVKTTKVSRQDSILRALVSMAA